MIRSMTGFGKGAQKSPYGKIIAEIKTLNNKNLSVTCNPFNGFFLLEEKIKDVFAGKLHRGKVFVRITREASAKQQPMKRVEINESAAREYLKKLEKMQRSLGIGGELSIQDIVSLPGVVEQAGDSEEEELWPYINKALMKAVRGLIVFRKAEGRRLSRDFTARLAKIKKLTAEIARYGKQGIEEYRAKLARTIKEINSGAEPDKGRIESEVALFARNCDITEELIRLAGHIISYKEAMKKVEADAGKKLDFIAQEMQREANTIGSKSADLRISKAVIEVKSEIERMREQIKNIE
jgi:uncharacterized protein (TIGR00255 family)